MSLTKISNTVTSDSSSNSYMFRNLIINGSMNIHQRSASVSGITTGGYYTADRWEHNITTSGTWNITTENDAPTGTGLRKSLKTTCAVVKTSLGSSDVLAIQQKLEGQNVQILKAGTSSAEFITVSFWVKSNLTGIYNCELSTSSGKFNSANYTINSADVWEKKTITYLGDTVSILQNDNTYALRIFFWCVAGSSFSNDISRTSWNISQGSRAINQVNLASTVGNYWQITGIQMEVGNTPTSFENLPYEIQLMRCQRYYNVINHISGNGLLVEGYGSASSPISSIYSYPVRMRAVPGISQTGTFSSSNISSLDFNTYKSDSCCTLRGIPASTNFAFFFMNTTDDSIIFNAEL